MSKRKSKKSTKHAKITIPVGYLASLSDSGDEDLDVSIRRYVAVEGSRTSTPIELNAWEARRFARALLKAADRLDGGR